MFSFKNRFTSACIESRNIIWTVLVILIFIPQIIVKAQPGEAYRSVEVLPPSMFDSSPVDFLDFNGKTVFTESYGAPLWITDGTLEGTTKITFPEWEDVELERTKYGNHAVVLNDKLYFWVEIDGDEHIWVTDGTQEGTHEAVNSESAGFFTFRDMKVFGNRIAFIAFVIDDGFDRIFLINENGTGAQMVDEVSRIYTAGIPPRMATIGDDLYTVETVGLDRKLVKIDQQGNVSTAWQMPEQSTADFRSINALTEVGDKIFFEGNDGTGRALWVFDGTAATRLFNPHESAEQQQDAISLTAVKDKLYFFSHPWNPENEDFFFNSYLYVSDGTIAGTYQIWNASLGNGYTQQTAENYPTAAAGDRLLFVAPYSSDTKNVFWGAGTTSNSFEVIEANGQLFKMYTGDPKPSPVENGAWFAASKDIIYTDGTTSGTYIVPRGEIEFVNELAVINERPWFAGRTTISGSMGVWRSLPESELNPAKPNLLSPAAYSDTASVLPTFVWGKSKNADSYHLQISSEDSFPDTLFSENTISDTTFTLSDSLQFLTTYAWRVRAQNADTTGEWSEVLTFTTIPQKTDAPVLTYPTNGMTNASDSLSFYWEVIETADTYNLQISESDDFSSLYIDTLVTYARSIENKIFEENTQYYWRVNATNAGGTSEWSQTWSFVTQTPTNIEYPRTTPDKFALNQNYPNPFNPSTVISYQLPKAEFVSIKVYDMLGREMAVLVNEHKPAGNYEVSFNAAGFSSGMYIYQMKAGNNVFNRRLMLIK